MQEENKQIDPGTMERLVQGNEQIGYYRSISNYEEALKTLNHQGHSWKLSQFANEKLQEDVQKIIRLAGSDGKA